VTLGARAGAIGSTNRSRKEHRRCDSSGLHRQLVPTKKSEIIKVMLREFDEEEGVAIVERRLQRRLTKRPAQAAFFG